eukprot:TRINITY_DN4350_c1_g1_i5.p1 TRINITY_DN4350_c1_g1~~TRINITY_DN4350_c1_g1_i5.p1  ORF type:complete len:313 (+),score=-18.17 TRINITY_DN4350_c1_g1_i5:621-1559(+)
MEFMQLFHPRILKKCLGVDKFWSLSGIRAARRIYMYAYTLLCVKIGAMLCWKCKYALTIYMHAYVYQCLFLYTQQYLCIVCSPFFSNFLVYMYVRLRPHTKIEILPNFNRPQMNSPLLTCPFYKQSLFYMSAYYPAREKFQPPLSLQIMLGEKYNHKLVITQAYSAFGYVIVYVLKLQVAWWVSQQAVHGWKISTTRWKVYGTKNIQTLRWVFRWGGLIYGKYGRYVDIYNRVLVSAQASICTSVSVFAYLYVLINKYVCLYLLIQIKQSSLMFLIAVIRELCCFINSSSIRPFFLRHTTKHKMQSLFIPES